MTAREQDHADNIIREITQRRLRKEWALRRVVWLVILLGGVASWWAILQGVMAIAEWWQ